jgi:hypothetical protein
MVCAVQCVGASVEEIMGRNLVGLILVATVCVSAPAFAAPKQPLLTRVGQRLIQLGERAQAVHEFKQFVRSSKQLRTDYRRDKSREAVGATRAATGVFVAGMAASAYTAGVGGGFLYTVPGIAAAIALPNFAVATHQALKDARTATVGRALARGEGPSPDAVKRWQSAGIINHLSK